MQTNTATAILTYNGRYFDYKNPSNFEFDINTIAHALSMNCRFAGHVETFYSVAQHSVLVSYLVPEEIALQALLHDASEAFIVDLPKPLKNMLPEYSLIEKAVEREIFRQFKVPLDMDPRVKLADRIMLATEDRDLMPDHDDEWEITKDVSPSPAEIVPLDCVVSKALYLARYNELRG